jgi:CRP-like cAMP-binding protein
MFSKTQRSADVYALKDCILLFISVEDFQEIMENKTKLAMKLLFALGSTMADRMVAFNRKFRTETSSEFNWV